MGRSAPVARESGACAGYGLRSTLAAGAEDAKRAGGLVWRARVGVGGVSNSIRAFPIGWVDVSILTPVRVRGGDGGGREARLGGICLWRVCLCGACSGHLSAVSRAALRPTRILLFRYYGIDTRAAASRPEKGGGRRWRSAPRPFGRFGLHAQPSCTASGVIDRGSACGAGAAGEERRRLSRAARRTCWGRRGRASGDRPKQPHACTAAPVKGEGGVGGGWVSPRGRGTRAPREARAGGQGLQCDV